MNVTMASAGTTVVAPFCAPSQFIFDAGDDLTKMYLSQTWTGAISFCCKPVDGLMVGLPLDKMAIQEVDSCAFLGSSPAHPPFVACLFLDPEEYNKPPLEREPISKNPHCMQLKDAANQTSGWPFMYNGEMDYR
jgi:hypothetical protein